MNEMWELGFDSITKQWYLKCDGFHVPCEDIDQAFRLHGYLVDSQDLREHIKSLIHEADEKGWKNEPLIKAIKNFLEEHSHGTA